MPVDEAVAQGAAVYAKYLQEKSSGKAGFRVRNVNSHTLGVLGIEPSTMMRRRKVMIARNTPLPAEHTQPFVTAEAGQKSVVVTVVEGGDDTGNHSTLIGRCVLAGLAPNLPPRSKVNVTFHYSEDGRLSVRAFMPAVERESTLTIERAQRNVERVARRLGRLARRRTSRRQRRFPRSKDAATTGEAAATANPLKRLNAKRMQRQVDVVADEALDLTKEKTVVLVDEPTSSATPQVAPQKEAVKPAPAEKPAPVAKVEAAKPSAAAPSKPAKAAEPTKPTTPAAKPDAAENGSRQARREAADHDFPTFGTVATTKTPATTSPPTSAPFPSTRPKNGRRKRSPPHRATHPHPPPNLHRKPKAKSRRRNRAGSSGKIECFVRGASCFA